MAIITTKDVSMKYNSRTVVSDISITVDSGDYLCIVGENGSGKSTFVKGLLGLMTPCGGTIEYGENMTHADIGYLPQHTEAQHDFPAVVGEIVISGCLGSMKFHPFYTKSQRELAVSNMKRLGIYEYRRRPYRALSGGQQQRVLLARALCAAKKLLVLDEPTAGLDPVVTAEMYEILADINKSDGLAVIMISHDIDIALKYADKILHINKTPLFFGTTDDYRKSDVGRRFIELGGC